MTPDLCTSVRTENGVVTLTGTARTREEKELVGRIARNIEGIRKVQNLVKVQPE
jgi:osmotically-inducible protein OsmY